MDYSEYKLKRNERIKHLYRTGVLLCDIKKIMAVDEKLIKEICKNEKRIAIKNWGHHYNA